ncbi:transcriptional regulator, MarR family [Coriobacterium glomerans PW2]|uniref:Transcriptional regulator, MarR family n=1 Tax=Coriobacterium glomerans (strain ATCC 49209 / DSM 20642 / JCM 10262 / PW2) TaxID=700015 RepID=F2N6Y4_CORGP|nr:MarR family winged helix-turn-helix transcriptional regulator [Coriobacterium glomerans]AEB06183.1 transcriptional regulator, MarR family [Coriobacterium glomerans PW2]
MAARCMEMGGIGTCFGGVGRHHSGKLIYRLVCALAGAADLDPDLAGDADDAAILRDGLRIQDVNYEDVARKLIVYSRSLAKGSLSTVHGASVGEAPVLQYLVNAKGDIIPSELAGRLGYTRGRMSHILDALESKGYIRRVQDERDRRRVIVSISDEGRRYAAERYAESVAALAHQLSALGEHDANELVRILNKAYSITYDKEDYLEDL